jgi:hypothetical protein
VIRRAEDLEQIRGIWESWQDHPNSDIDFYLHVLRSRSQVLRPHIIVVCRDGQPDGMLVGRLEQSRIEMKIGYASLPGAQARVLGFIYGGLLGNRSSENCQMLVREILENLRQREADLAALRFVRTDYPIYRFARCLPGPFTRDLLASQQVHRCMTVPKSMDEFYGRLSSKVRKNLKWQAKKFLHDFAGNLRIHCFRESAELEPMMKDAEDIARKTYQRGLGVGFTDNAEMRDRFRLEANKGWLRAHLLYASDKPCAFWIGTQYKDTFHSNFMGYDPTYAKYSPGMFLVMKVIESFCKDANVAQIDFGLGDAQYKETLSTQQWFESTVHIFAPNLTGLKLNLLRTAPALVDQSIRRILERTQLLPKVKKIWRNLKRQEPESNATASAALPPEEQ